jgi:hypothetical protein
MESKREIVGVSPDAMDVRAGVGSDAGVVNGSGKVEYQTGKGCLMFALVALVLIVITVGVIMLAGDPATVVG